MKTIKFITLGCKVNQYDSQSIRERFFARGFKEAQTNEQVDYFLINTCSVTANADQKSRNLIRGCIKAYPQAKVIVTGCIVEKDTSALSAIEGIDYIISKNFFSDGISNFAGHTRAFLKVQDGCNNFCAYCKVPLVRGRSRSRALKEVVREAKMLVKSGHKEIVLTGICLGSYGLDLYPKFTLVDLLKELEVINGLYRIRLSSIEAKDVTKQLIILMAASKKICHHLHIPMQSGDDQILKLMQRRDSKKSYIQLIENIKSKVRDVGITTDVIVGFPGETDQAFNNTLQLLKATKPLRVHGFPYSPRRGTRAFLMSGRVSPIIIKDRVKKVQGIANTLSKDWLKDLIGEKIEVLFEARSSKYPGFYEGYTHNYIKVISKAEGVAVNKIIYLQVFGVLDNSLILV